MPISATCPGCGKRITGPDSAAGHKAKCPKCGQVVQFPKPDSGQELAEAVKGARSGRMSPSELAKALSQGPAEAEAEAEQEAEQPAKEPPSSESSGPATPTPSRAEGSATRSTTTVSRLLARTSPYQSLRLLGVVIFGMGVGIAILAFLGGLTALVLLAMYGSPGLAVVLFVASLVVAAVAFVGGKTVSELVRLWADVGDRARHVSQMFEESLGRPRRNGD